MKRSRKISETPEITVRSLQRVVRIDVVDLQRFAAQAVRFCLDNHRREGSDLTKLREIFVLLVSDRRMARLRRQFLCQAGPTDVMTFRHGEIFISAETARRHARRFGNLLAQELRLYVVHGLLHLQGFDDQNEIEARKMERTQARVVSALRRR
jgi:probable rRNA maturation factor